MAFDPKHMQMAIDLALESIQNNGGPFAAVIVRNGRIVGRGHNTVTSSFDPTAHAEVNAIRDACNHLQAFQLSDCEIYTSCEPCPMCLGAIYWARPKAIYYGCSKQDAANAGFDDQFIYDELDIAPAERKIPSTQHMQDQALSIFQTWTNKEDKTEY
ncbi:nucleoside deaminase [Reichenbachiella agarivorans]|uniref:Nucleoside deaminase n=1 Tax=Reichenbachiella agarivorans TaxID=2979464 RepID=A0ABY6CTS4_9BACT|nr:nucleoside deaminase [Reichenbachiella agarivorans]UXP33921.1 nucleoside deaminase [Reichenbachiella agarivorans]